MSALFVGDTASTALLAFSPWVIPLIAVAAKLTYDQTRNACRSDVPRRPSDRENAGPEDRPRDREALHEGIKTSLAGK
jgi:hypothetical protein